MTRWQTNWAQQRFLEELPIPDNWADEFLICVSISSECPASGREAPIQSRGAAVIERVCQRKRRINPREAVFEERERS